MSTACCCANAACIEREIAWFREVLDLRMKLHVGDTDAADHGEKKAGVRRGSDLLEVLEPPALPPVVAPYAEVIRRFEMTAAARLVLILSYVPHVQPGNLDPFFIQNRSLERRFTEFGGLVGLSHGGFLPTGETAMFLLAGEDIEARLRYYGLFSSEHYLYRHNILRLEHRHRDEPPLSAALHLSAEYRERLTTGRSYQPPFSPEFPAQRLTTSYDWSDLVLDRQAREEIQDIVVWVEHQHTLMEDWGLKKRLKPGFRALFYGPPGTGKTLTASLLGKATGKPVYRVDLSRVVSKYIGETEKNLASLFDHAEHQDWILFFDEADALFGKRTESRTANDRAANQQISYLLQRIEDFPGIVILATNLRSHMDEAFARRFQAMIHFPIPSAEQRLRLWTDSFADKPYPLAADVDLRQLARDHKISGGSIINVLRYACMKAVVRRPQEVRGADLLHALKRERLKEGKFVG